MPRHTRIRQAFGVRGEPKGPTRRHDSSHRAEERPRTTCKLQDTVRQRIFVERRQGRRHCAGVVAALLRSLLVPRRSLLLWSFAACVHLLDQVVAADRDSGLMNRALCYAIVLFKEPCGSKSAQPSRRFQKPSSQRKTFTTLTQTCRRAREKPTARPTIMKI